MAQFSRDVMPSVYVADLKEDSLLVDTKYTPFTALVAFNTRNEGKQRKAQFE